MKGLKAVPSSHCDIELTTNLLTRFARDCNGQVAVIAAILMPVIIGGLALGVEVGLWYMVQDRLQNVADVSAHAAATRLKAGDEDEEATASALRVAIRSGHDQASGVLEVNRPPIAGSNAGDDNFVEVVVKEERKRLFTAIFEDKPVQFQGRAVAHVKEGKPVCVLALSDTDNASLTISTSANVDLNGCSAATNSTSTESILLSPGAELNADCLQTMGEALLRGSLDLRDCDRAITLGRKVMDPYRDVVEPVASAIPCRSVLSVAGVKYIYPMDFLSGVRATRICGGLNLQGVNILMPGLYVIDGGDFSVSSGAIVTGADITLYLTNGAAAKFSGLSTLTMSAPTQGPFAGMLLFGSRRDESSLHEIVESSASRLQGAIYSPSSDIEFTSTLSWRGTCTQLIADKITLSGQTKIDLGCGLSNMRDISLNREVVLVE